MGKFAVLASVTALAVVAVSAGDSAFAQQIAAGQALQDAVDRTCVVEISSMRTGQIELQNICLNPRAVRISWGDGRLMDYCLNSAGDVRYVQKLSDTYKLTREQDILLCQ